MRFFYLFAISVLIFANLSAEESLAPVKKKVESTPSPQIKEPKAPAQTSPKPNQGSQIAVVVNKNAITYQDIYDRAALILLSSNSPNTEENIQKIFAQVKNSLIQEKIQMQVCKDLKITVSDNEVKEALSQLAKQNNMSYEDMQNMFKAKGVNIRTLEDRSRAQLGWVRAVREVFGQLVIISDKEAEQALAQSKKDMNKKRYELMEIVAYVDNAKRESEVKTTLKNIYAELRQGAPFPVMARQFSQSTSASNNGYLGWFTEGSRPPSEQEIISKMKPSDFSSPIKFNGGYRILYLKDIQNPGESPLGESVITYFTMAIPFADALSEEEQHHILTKIEEIKNAKDCAQFKKLGEDMGYSLGEPAPTAFRDLPDELEKLFISASVGSVVGPIRSGNQLILFMLCRKQSAGKPKESTLEEEKHQLYVKKLEGMATREFNKLMSMAFIDDKTPSK